MGPSFIALIAVLIAGVLLIDVAIDVLRERGRREAREYALNRRIHARSYTDDGWSE